MSEEKKKRKEIAVEEIPASVMEVVDRVIPGGTIEKAGKRERKDKAIYKVKKSVEAGKYEIKVTSDGALIEAVRENTRRRRRRHSHRRRDSHEHHRGHHRKERRKREA